jgi:predicted nucleic acid-binding protein
MKSVVSNTSPLIALSMIEQFPLLFKLFQEVSVPNAVYREVVESKSLHEYGKRITGCCNRNQSTIYTVQNEMLVEQLYGKMHRGELEVIVAAKELSREFVLIDEKTARNFAEMNLLTPIGTIGLLVAAKRQGFIDALKPYLDLLLERGFRINREIYISVLRESGELK